MIHSIWITELKFRIFTIDIEVWREWPEGTTNSSRLCCDHLKSIISVLVIHFGTNWSVRPSRDHVSISPRSCVDFARCSLEFSSDLKNIHRDEECREKAKIGDRVFQDFDRPDGRPTCTRFGSVNRPVNRNPVTELKNSISCFCPFSIFSTLVKIFQI